MQILYFSWPVSSVPGWEVLRVRLKEGWITRRIRVMAGKLCALVSSWVGLGGNDVRSQVWLAVKEASVVAQELSSYVRAISSQIWVGVRTQEKLQSGLFTQFMSYRGHRRTWEVGQAVISSLHPQSLAYCSFDKLEQNA